MNRFLKIPLLAATLALPMLLSSCVVDGYAYREPYGGRYYDDDYYSYPVTYGRSYYGGGYPYSSYYGGYPYGYYGGGALIGSSYYYRNRYRHYDHDHHGHYDGGHRRHYSSSGRSGSTYANRQVRHGDHYHSSQLKKNQHQAMIRRGDSTPSSRTVSSRSSSSSKSKGGVSARERKR